MDTQEKIDLMEGVIQQLDDIANSYQALIEKMARAQMELDSVDDLTDVSETLQVAFSHASEDHQAVSGLSDDVQMKVNQLRQSN